MQQLRQALLLCYLQILRQFLNNRQTPDIRRAIAYDANNQITGVNVPYAGNISYDAYQWTRFTSITLPSNSGKKQYAYDELMRTKTIASNDPNQNALMNYQYTYDRMDNIKTRNTQLGNYAYNYDNLYRLNEVKKDDTQTESYSYDQVGNRLTSTTVNNWTYNANNELLSYNGTANQYDADGNTIQRTVSQISRDIHTGFFNHKKFIFRYPLSWGLTRPRGPSRCWRCRATSKFLLRCDRSAHTARPRCWARFRPGTMPSPSG